MQFHPINPSRSVLPAVGFLTAVQMATNPAWADQDPPASTSAVATSIKTTAAHPAPATLPDANRRWAHSHRVSSLIGAEVRDRHGDRVGEVRDIVLDDQGILAYAIVSGQAPESANRRLHAVPWSALSRQDDGNFGLDIDKATLQGVAGFGPENWPDFSDPQWQAGNQRHYHNRIHAEPFSAA